MRILDSTGKIELSVGMTLTDDRKIIALRPEGDEEGGPPQVVVDGLLEGERLDCHALNYAAEGPEFPENWVCGEVELPPKVTTAQGPRKAVTIVYRDGLPVGHVTYVPPTKHYAAKVYCVPAPFDWFGGSYPALEDAVVFVAKEGETPTHMREDKRYHAKEAV